MHTIEITEINNYEYKGLLNGNIEVQGDFYLDWDNDMPLPQIDNCQIEATGEMLNLELITNLEQAETQIAEHGDLLDWLADLQASKVDWAYDTLRDC